MASVLPQAQDVEGGARRFHGWSRAHLPRVPLDV